MNESANAALVVITTAETAETAERLAQTLVERELAACVQLAPITAIYRWQGKVEQAAEILLLIKTTRAAYAELEAAISAWHSYQTPEIIALPVEAGAAGYLAWLQASVRTVA